MFQLKPNPILATDSYKLSHRFAYPKNVTGMFSYIESRSRSETIVPFGLQMWIMKTLSQNVTIAHIEEAEGFANLHGLPFDREPWLYVVRNYNGRLPLTIRAVPEGTPVPSGMPLVTVECTDPKLFWLSSYIETSLLRGIWYPTTIASADRQTKIVLKNFYEATGADMGMIPFALHDFGGRGVTTAEQAEVGGAAHLVNFMGSDTLEGVRAANEYYRHPMAAFSVPATEHSIQCSFGPSTENAMAYLNHVIDTFAKPGKIVSIVLDGYDVYRESCLLCTALRKKIVDSGAKIVFRPDSGDPMDVIPKILFMQAETFGYDVNEKGYKKIRNVGIIQGDGIDRNTAGKILSKLQSLGYAADNIVFGSGGGLLQKVNRDTYKFAQKASAVLVDGVWKGIAKDPITDPGKKSKEGRVSTARSLMDGGYIARDLDRKLNEEFVDVMEVIYHNGDLVKETTLDEIRKRAEV